MILGIIALILVLLAILPIGINAVYSEDGAAVRLIAGPLRFLVFPKPRKTAKAQKKEAGNAKKTPAKKKDGGSVKDFFPLVHRVLNFLGDLRTKLRVDRLELKLILGGDDPCDLALNYGRAWAAFGNLMPHLERVFVIKKRDVEVECDFQSAAIRVYARVDLTITVARILSLGLRHGFHIIREYLAIMNKRKGGAKL